MDSIRLVGSIAGRRRILTIRKAENVVGGSLGADFVLDDPSVAPRHARLVLIDETLRLSPLDRTGTTEVNGRRINGETILRLGDEIRFGSVRFIVEIEKQPSASPVPPSESRPPLAKSKPARSNLKSLIAFASIVVVIAFVAVFALLNWEEIETVADNDTAAVRTASTTQSINAAVLPAARPSGPSALIPSSSATTSPESLITPTSTAEDLATTAWLGPLNYYRNLAGLAAVKADSVLNQSNAAHAHYLLNKYGEQIYDVGGAIHDEDPSQPGYSEAGNRAAQNSNIAARPIVHGRLPQPRDAIEGWLQTPFHRLWELNPALEKAGYGEACTAKTCVEVLDILTDIPPLNPKPSPFKQPITFPPANSVLPFTTLQSEWPEPLAACPGYSRPAGFPITLQLGAFVPVKLSHYALTRNDTNPSPLEVCVFTADSYANSDSTQRERVHDVLMDFGAVVMIPRAPLEPGRYAVSFTIDRDYTWAFAIK